MLEAPNIMRRAQHAVPLINVHGIFERRQEERAYERAVSRRRENCGERKGC